jgi:hypothetical protein
VQPKLKLAYLSQSESNIYKQSFLQRNLRSGSVKVTVIAIVIS